MFANAIRQCKKSLSRGSIRQNVRKLSVVPIGNHTTSPGHQSFDPAESASYKWPLFWKNSKNRTHLPLESKLRPQTMSMVSEEERLEFKSIFPDIVEDLTATEPHPDLSEAVRHFTKALHYNVPNGELSRGLAVVASYKMLESPEKLTPENVRLANILGWCAELLQASFIIDDDIMDASQTRRGVPCWHNNKEVGLLAINDAEMLTNGIYLILKKYFSGLKCYIPILELVRDVNMKTTMGQSLDTMCMVSGKPQLELFTMERYTAMAKYKTAYLAFQLPMALAMFFAGKYDPKVHEQATTILLEMAHFHQVENDVLDCFGDPAVTGKKGTDIQEGKCSWLIVVALLRATRAQRMVLEKNYGRQERECKNAVRALYQDMNLLKLFSRYEKQSFNRIHTLIQNLFNDLPQELFYKYLEKTFGRKCL